MSQLPPKTHNLAKLTLAGEWYRQRDEWMRELTEASELSLPARLVGVHIALRMNRQSRKVMHMQATLAKQTGLAPETVRAALAQLRKAKMVRVKKAKGINGRAVNHYSLIHAYERGFIVDGDD